MYMREITNAKRKKWREKKRAIEKGGGGESENTIERENKNWLK